jgi:hypothetical protein
MDYIEWFLGGVMRSESWPYTTSDLGKFEVHNISNALEIEVQT